MKTENRNTIQVKLSNKKHELKFMKHLLAILFLFQIHLSVAQKTLYVSAENGLIVRSGPNKNANRIGKINYAEEIISFQNTNRFLEIIDDGLVIKGEWYQVSANEESGNVIEGYVFSGFLTSKEPKKKINIKFEKFSIQFDHIALLDSEKTLSNIQKDTVKLNCDVAGSLENKKIKILSTSFKKIEIYQRFQNSITVMNEGPHCDLVNWKHYDSHWEKIPFIKNNNVFKTVEYSTIDKNQFIPIDIEELKNAVEEHCGAYWSKLITNLKNATEYPFGVSTNKMFIKIVITDKKDSVSEKIIEFTIPMGC